MNDNENLWVRCYQNTISAMESVCLDGKRYQRKHYSFVKAYYEAFVIPTKNSYSMNRNINRTYFSICRNLSRSGWAWVQSWSIGKLVFISRGASCNSTKRSGTVKIKWTQHSEQRNNQIVVNGLYHVCFELKQISLEHNWHSKIYIFLFLLIFRW